MPVVFSNRGIVRAPPPDYSSPVAGGSDWQLDAGHYETAAIALEIIQPRSGLTTANRYYKQYTGLHYRVPVVVHGGSYPFKYELTAAPSGMTIGEVLGDTDYGIINWVNPVESGSPHTITVLVTDQEGTTASVTWTLTVDTTNAIFLDSVSGSDANAGTFASPKQTPSGYYGANKTLTTYSGYFVYYKAGTYRMDSCPAEAISTGSGVIFNSTNKPLVHLAVHGAAVVVNTEDAMIANNSGAGRMYFGGLTFEGLSAGGGYKTFLGFGGPGHQFFANTFQSQVDAGVSGQNPAHMFVDDGDGSSVSDFGAVTHCAFNTVQNVLCFEAYKANKWVIANNTIDTITGADARFVYLKDTCKDFTIRANVGTNGIRRPILFSGHQGVAAADVLVTHNLWIVANSADDMMVIGSDANPYGTHWIQRNTFAGGQISHNWASGGPLNYTRNVRQHSGAGTNGIVTTSATFTVNQTEELQATSGLVDSAGLLTGANRTTYLGIRGHEVA